MVGFANRGRLAAVMAAAMGWGVPAGAMAQQAPVVVPGAVVQTAEDEALWIAAYLMKEKVE